MIATIRIATTPATAYSTADRLTTIGSIRRPLSGNGTSAENANMSITLDNGDGLLTAAFADPPLRLACAVEVDGYPAFSGTITQVSISSVITLEVQA